MGVVVVRNVKIGEGIPKICVPIIGRTKEEILKQAQTIAQGCADIVEWRADWYEEVLNIERFREVLTDLRGILGEKPLLFTFRSLREGGERSIGRETYVSLNQIAVETGCVDLVDGELSMGIEILEAVIKVAHEKEKKVIVSSHDFERTPEKEELIQKMRQMQETGADICKVAVMPQDSRDVITLLSATEEMYRLYAKCPLITMSMDGTGAISRLCGEWFGSAVTFGMEGYPSAPGQIASERLRDTLLFFHEVMNS
ncbi:MAG: type I 3-dehydroquinate dehydratase [Eubacteriales bacterium]|nr:type I 3-dehydroquinate dehydratase [Eubacteriales bacterium]